MFGTIKLFAAIKPGRLGVAALLPLFCACADVPGGGDSHAQDRLAAPGADGGAAQPSAQTAEGGAPAAPPGAGSNPGTSTTSGGNANDAGAASTGPVDLGQNSQGDAFFRADTMVLKAPNLFLKVIFETNITADGQAMVDTALTTDEDMNGFVDMSLLLRFLKTQAPNTANGQLTPGGGMCPLPLDGTKACGPDTTFPFQTPAVTYTNGQGCMLAGTQESAAGACFVSAPASITMQLPILGAVPLQDGQVIGSWDGPNIGNGRVRGFLPKTVAAVTKLGEGLPPAFGLLGIKAGTPLTNFLSDRELQKNARGEDGWWFLVNYTAKPAKFDPTTK